MSFNGSGTFSINTTGQPVVAATTISASVFNAFTADIATGLSTCMLKDGTQTATAGIGFYAGTVSLPGIYFGTDTATGLYRIGLNNDGYSINGTKLLDLSSALVGITGALTVSSTANISGLGTFSAGLALSGTASNLSLGSNYINNTGATTDEGISIAVGGAVSFSSTITIAGTSALNGYKSGTWTPTFNGFTTVGGNSSTATYVRIGKMMFVTIQAIFGTSSASTAGTSNISGMPYANTRAAALVSAASNGTAISFGSGYGNASGGLYTPTWGATQSVVISAFYETDDAF